MARTLQSHFMPSAGLVDTGPWAPAWTWSVAIGVSLTAHGLVAAWVMKTPPLERAPRASTSAPRADRVVMTARLVMATAPPSAPPLSEPATARAAEPPRVARRAPAPRAVKVPSAPVAIAPSTPPPPPPEPESARLPEPDPAPLAPLTAAPASAAASAPLPPPSNRFAGLYAPVGPAPMGRSRWASVGGARAPAPDPRQQQAQAVLALQMSVHERLGALADDLRRTGQEVRCDLTVDVERRLGQIDCPASADQAAPWVHLQGVLVAGSVDRATPTHLCFRLSGQQWAPVACPAADAP